MVNDENGVTPAGFRWRLTASGTNAALVAQHGGVVLGRKSVVCPQRRAAPNRLRLRWVVIIPLY